MLKIKNRFLLIRRRWSEALPTILVSLSLFLTFLKFFGIAQVMLVSFFTLTFRVRSRQGFDLRDLLKCYLIQLLIFLASYAAVQNLILCVCLNLIIPFLLVYLLTDKFNPKAYFVYGMEFVFLQMIPITARQIPMRLAALLYGQVFVTLALFLYAGIIRKRRHYGTVRKGINNMAVQLAKLADGESVRPDGQSLERMMYHMNQVIYSSRNYSYLANGYGTVNYYFMIVFQRFLYFVKKIPDEAGICSGQNRDYFLKLSEILFGVERQMDQTDNGVLIERIKAFIQKERLESGKLNESMGGILELLCYALWKITEVSKNKAEKEWKIPSQTHKVRGIRRQFRLSQFHMRFALRLAIVLCVSFVFCRVTNLEHSYWYPMSAFLMLMPYSEESTMKVNNRMAGTIAGLFVTFFLTETFKTLNAHIAIILVTTCLMYYAPVTSWTMTMYSTCYGMALTTLSLPRGEAIGLRLLYVLAAVVTVLLANRFILPNTASREFLKDINDLIDIDKAMARETRKGGKSDINLLRELFVRCNLAAEEIRDYISRNMSEEEQEFYRQLLPMNRQLVSEIEQIGSYMRRHNLSPEDSIILGEILENIERGLEDIRRSYTRKELNDSIRTGATEETYGSLDEELYFNRLAFDCLNTVQSMQDLFASREIRAEAGQRRP